MTRALQGGTYRGGIAGEFGVVEPIWRFSGIMRTI
jgi:hypothetical protein